MMIWRHCDEIMFLVFLRASSSTEIAQYCTAHVRIIQCAIHMRTYVPSFNLKCPFVTIGISLSLSLLNPDRPTLNHPAVLSYGYFSGEVEPVVAMDVTEVTEPLRVLCLRCLEGDVDRGGELFVGE